MGLIAFSSGARLVHEVVYINGQYFPKKEAKVSVFDHGLLYGDGVFEGLRFYSRNLFRLKEHVDRLFSSAKYILLNIGHTPEEVIEVICETCRRNNLEDGYIRLMVTRGEGSLGLSPYLCPKASLIIIVSSIQLYPPQYYDNGLPIITASTRRTSPDAISPRVKSLNYLNNIMAKMEAVHSGHLEALMLDSAGYIVECTADNFFLFKDNVLFTPPTYQGALRGITRDAVIDLAREAGIEVREQRLTLYEAYDADESFLSGTAAEIIPVISIDKRSIGTGAPGPKTRLLIEKFREITTTQGIRF